MVPLLPDNLLTVGSGITGHQHTSVPSISICHLRVLDHPLAVSGLAVVPRQAHQRCQVSSALVWPAADLSTPGSSTKHAPAHARLVAAMRQPVSPADDDPGGAYKSIAWKFCVVKLDAYAIY